MANGHSPTSSEGDSATQDSTASTTKGEGKGRKGMNGVKNEEEKKGESSRDMEWCIGMVDGINTTRFPTG